MANEPNQHFEQAILNSIRGGPSGGTAVAVGGNGARTETQRFDYKAQMMNRHDDNGGDVLDDERNTSLRAQQQQGQQPQEDLNQEKALQKQEQAARNKKLCVIGSIVVALLAVAVVVIAMVLVVGGGSDDSGNTTNNNSENVNTNSAPSNPQPTAPPAPSPTVEPGTAAPSVAVENLDIQVHFETLSFWFVQYGFHYVGCEADAPPNLTVSTASKEYFVQLQAQSERGTGNVTCDRVARNEVSCYPQDSNVTEFTTMLLFVTGSMAGSEPCSEIQVTVESTKLQNCDITSKIRTGTNLGHVCFPNNIAARFDDLQYHQSFASSSCQSGFGFDNDFDNTVDPTINKDKFLRVCVMGGTFIRDATSRLAASETSALPHCHLSRDDTAAPPFQWNPEAIWKLADNYLFLVNFIPFIVDPF